MKVSSQTLRTASDGVLRVELPLGVSDAEVEVVIVYRVLKAGDRPAAKDTLEIRRKDHPHAYEAWTPEEEAQLRAEFGAGKSIAEISATHQRKPGAIRSRLKRFGIDVEMESRNDE